jgi:hypothetical protein
MHARSFFYVSLGILALALAYHLGAASAGAQSGSISATWAGQANGDATLAVVGRTLYGAGEGMNGIPLPTGPIPGTEAVVGIGMNPNDTIAILANGDVWRSLNGAPWTFAWNVLGSSTATLRTTFGSIKARYR